MRACFQRLTVGCLTLAALSQNGMAREFVRNGTVPISSDPANPTAPHGAPNHEPRGVAITTDGGHTRAWVVDYGTPGLAVFDLAHTPAVQEAFLAAPAGFGRPIALDAKNGVVAVVTFDPTSGSHVAVYDAAQLGSPIAAFAVGGPPKESVPGGIAIADDVAVLVTDHSRNAVRGYFYRGAEVGQPTGPERITIGVGAASIRVIHVGSLPSHADTAVVALTESGTIDLFRVLDHRVAGPSRTFDVGLRPESVFTEPAGRSGTQIMVAAPGSDSVFGLGIETGPAPYALRTEVAGPVDVCVTFDLAQRQHVFVVSRNRPQVTHFASDRFAYPQPAFVDKVALRGAPAGVASIADPSGAGIRVIVSSAQSDGIEDFLLR